MASNYRKKVKVAPGVYLNISKSGISTSLGVRGASMTFGRNGAYINTGIPGSGYYNRRPISGGAHKAPGAPLPPGASETNNMAGGGCLLLLVSVGCVIAAFVTDNSYYWIGAAVLAIASLVLAAKSAKPKPRDCREELAHLAEAKKALDNATNPAERRILESFINTYEVIDEIDDEEKILEKLRKQPGENDDEIREHRRTLAELRESLGSAQYDADAALGEAALAAYATMCEAFENLQECEKIWLVTSQEESGQSRSSSSTGAGRREGCVFSGVFNYLKSQFDVPAFEVEGGATLYFYPEFVILARRPGSFQLISYRDITVTSAIQRFNEGEPIPSDAGKDGHTWRYVNSEGGPDRRFTDNPRIQVAACGKLTIHCPQAAYTFHFSNYGKTKTFVSAVDEFKAALEAPAAGTAAEHGTGGKRHKKSPLTSADASQGPGSPSSSPQKPEFNFSLALSSATRLYEELKAMNADPQVIEALDRNQRLLDPVKVLPIRGLDVRVAVLGAMAALQCFEKLGHNEIDSDEGLALSLFLLQILEPESRPLWSSEECMREEEGRKLREHAYLLFKENFKIKGMDDRVLFIELLREEGVEEATVNRFAVLLYRFARVIAVADAVISPSEKEWLVDLLSFTTQGAGSDDRPGDTVKGSGKDTVKNDGKESSGAQKPAVNDAEAPAKPAEETTSEQAASTVLPPAQGDALKELASLIGLDTVKTEVQNIYNLAKIQKVREQKGLKSSTISYHCVFTGNPGTGKTTVARLVAQIYKDLGILSRGHLVETDRSGLVAEYVGQTAAKTNKIINSALDGVLFIDEAYSLVQDSRNDYGMEAISTLLKRMEDDRDRLVVILAGYSAEMKKFIDSNPGLQSRFSRYIHFDDYDADALVEIYGYNLNKYEYRLTDEGRSKLRQVITAAINHKDSNFGNARYVRNLFEKTLENQARRLVAASCLSEEILTEITAEDIPDYTPPSRT